MRIKAQIGNQDLMVLIDSGSMHNFINSKMADKLQLPVIPTDPFTVHVVDENWLQCRGKFEQVWVNLQGIPFALTLYLLPLTGLGLLLGVQWLEQLGPVVCNWKMMTMEFHWKDQARKLQGLDNPTIQSASLKVMSKEVNQGSSTFVI